MLGGPSSRPGRDEETRSPAYAPPMAPPTAPPTTPPATLGAAGHPDLDLDPPRRPRLMGILNATPDSFSDGGRFADPPSAAAHAVAMARSGAAIIDVGGESTRPGAVAVAADEQTRRVAPVIRAVRSALDAAGYSHVWISVDTRLAAVAAAGLDAGAAMINDVSAGRHDPAMLALAAERGCAVCLMHMLGEPGTMQNDPRYGDVVAEVRAFLLERAAAAEAAGVEPGRLMIDPGIGFGKTLEHNLSLLASIGELVDTGYPVLIGASRKRFIAALDPGASGGGESGGGGEPDADHREAGTVAVTLRSAAGGASVVRVHDVASSAQALAVDAAIARAKRAGLAGARGVEAGPGGPSRFASGD